MPSIISDKTPCDPHHWPVKRSGLAGDGLLEMVPLTREEHDLAEQGDPWTIAFIEANAPAYFKRIYQTYAGSHCYLGPLDRVLEIRAAVLKDTEMRRHLLGVN